MTPKQPCAKYQYVITPAGPKILPVSEQQSKDEENPADYNTGGYLPVTVGDQFKDGRYTVVRKLGWGHFSTVWLVRDGKSSRHCALKVVKSAGRYAETARDEIKLLSHIARASPNHLGRDHIVSFLDSFSHTPTSTNPTSGTVGTYSHHHNLSAFTGTPTPAPSHVCIIFEPLGENLLALIERNKQRGIPRTIVKIIARQLLLGLQYLHDECSLVHTDIKPENILISIPNIESHIHTELTLSPHPTSRRVGVPLPPSPHSRLPSHASNKNIRYPDSVAIPRRQVDIFNSQPLGSPRSGSRSASVVNGTAFTACKVGFPTPMSSPCSSLPNSSALPTTHLPIIRPPLPKTSFTTVPIVAHSSQSASLFSSIASPPASTSSSASSSASNTIATSTPATSLSQISALSALGMARVSSINETIKSHQPHSLQGDLAAAIAEPVVTGWREQRYEAGWRESVAASLRPLSSTSSPLRPTPMIGTSSPLNPNFSLPSPKPAASASVQIKLSPTHTRQSSLMNQGNTSPRVSSSWTDRIGLASWKRKSCASLGSSSTSTSVPRPGRVWISGCTAPAPALVIPKSVVTVTSSGGTLETEKDVAVSAIAAPPSHSTPPLPSPSLLSRTAPATLAVNHKSTASSGSSITSPSSSVTPMPASPNHPPVDGPATPPPTPSSPNAPPAFLTSSIPTSSTDAPSSPPPIAPSPHPILIKIADLGNATPISKHYTEDIQTRQYRAPEAILGRKDWGPRVDIWSVACVVFELLTAEYLFDPAGQGELFTKDDDHMAQIIELLGDFPLDAKMGGRYSRELFDTKGALRYIRTLKPWPLRRVMTEKYLYADADALALCNFLEPMLAPDMRARKDARDILDHPWLQVTATETQDAEW